LRAFNSRSIIKAHNIQAKVLNKLMSESPDARSALIELPFKPVMTIEYAKLIAKECRAVAESSALNVVIAIVDDGN
jgi:hypothetical protein